MAKEEATNTVDERSKALKLAIEKINNQWKFKDKLYNINTKRNSRFDNRSRSNRTNR